MFTYLFARLASKVGKIDIGDTHLELFPLGRIPAFFAFFPFEL